MSDNIFISYRREDSEHAAARLYRRLERDFPREQLFIDIDNLKLGHDFGHALDGHLIDCRAVIAVIGPSWLNAKDKAGRRRLDDPNDFVRLELTAALKRNVLLIPVLVGGATMPAAADLPDPLKPFSRRLGIALRHESFDADAIPLVQALGGAKARGHAPAAAPAKRGGFARIAGLLALALCAAAAAFWLRPDSCSIARVYEYPSGRFEREGRNTWVEHHQGQKYATFEQFDTSEGYILLVDKSRSRPIRPGEVADFYVRLPICGGQSHWSYSNPLNWQALHLVRPVE